MVDIIGKTILSVDSTSSSNIIRMKFTDGTEVVIDTMPIGYGLYAPEINKPDGYGFEFENEEVSY